MAPFRNGGPSEWRPLGMAAFRNGGPEPVGSLLRLNSTRNSRGSEIISHFRPGAVRCGPVSPGAVNSHTGRSVLVPKCP